MVISQALSSWPGRQSCNALTHRPPLVRFSKKSQQTQFLRVTVSCTGGGLKRKLIVRWCPMSLLTNETTLESLEWEHKKSDHKGKFQFERILSMSGSGKGTMCYIRCIHCVTHKKSEVLESWEFSKRVAKNYLTLSLWKSDTMLKIRKCHKISPIRWLTKLDFHVDVDVNFFVGQHVGHLVDTLLATLSTSMSATMSNSMSTTLSATMSATLSVTLSTSLSTTMSTYM